MLTPEFSSTVTRSAPSVSDSGWKAAAAVDRCRPMPRAVRCCSTGRRDLVVHGRKDLVGQLDHVHLDAAVVQVLGHLEADVAGADDHGAHDAALAVLLRGQGGVEPGLDLVHVADAAQHLDGGVVDAGQRRPQRLGAHAQGQLVVGLGVLLAAVDLADRDGLLLAVDRDHLGGDAHVDVERLAQALRGLQQQAVAIGDDLAHVVRQAAVRERDVVASFEDHDLGGFVEPPGARCGRSACSHTSDDYKLHDNASRGIRFPQGKDNGPRRAGPWSRPRTLPSREGLRPSPGTFGVIPGAHGRPQALAQRDRRPLLG